MKTVQEEDYRAIVWEGRVYVPYCAVANRERGRQIGIVDGDERDQVYEYRGYQSEKWIISFYHSGLMDHSLLMREQTVTDIPEGLLSEHGRSGE